MKVLLLFGFSLLYFTFELFQYYTNTYSAKRFWSHKRYFASFLARLSAISLTFTAELIVRLPRSFRLNHVARLDAPKPSCFSTWKIFGYGPSFRNIQFQVQISRFQFFLSFCSHRCTISMALLLNFDAVFIPCAFTMKPGSKFFHKPEFPWHIVSCHAPGVVSWCRGTWATPHHS